MKKIIFYIFIQALAVASFSQQENLLWYQGKLIKPNVLLTIKGDTVIYSPQKNQVRIVSKAGSGKKMDGMLAEINKTPIRIEEEIKRLSQVVPRHILPDLSANLIKAYTSVEASWKPILQNIITIPDGPELVLLKSGNSKEKGGPSYSFEETTFSDPGVEELRKQIKELKEKHKPINSSILPIPPRYNFSYCFPCDSLAVQRYKKDKDQFFAEMYGDDTTLSKKVLSYASSIQKKGLLNNSYYSEANNELMSFMNYMQMRNAEKVKTLVELYQNDPYRIPAVIDYWLPVERELQLMGMTEESPIKGHNFWELLFTTLDNFFYNSMQERDYSIGLNINAILAFERQKQLLGKKGYPLYLQVSSFNQFKLNSNITAKLGKDGEHIMGHARGDNWYHAIPDKKTCRLNWYLSGLPTEKPEYNLIAGEMVGAPVQYVGTKKWMSEVPDIKIDFCYKEGEEPVDSVIASTFHPQGFQELWQYPEPTGVLNITNIGGAFMACFLDVERIKKEAEQMNKDKIEQMKKEMQEKYAKLAGADMKTINSMAMNSRADMEKLNREIKELLIKNNPAKYIFMPQVHNKDVILFKEKLDGREIFPENTAILYAFFHLTMEHDTNGGHPLLPEHGSRK